MAYNYNLLPRVQRSVRMAFIRAKAQIPVDTGTLRNALIAERKQYGYRIHFINERINPKSKARVGVYKEPVDTRGRSAGYWKRFRDAFYSDLGTNLHTRISKGGI